MSNNAYFIFFAVLFLMSGAAFAAGPQVCAGKTCVDVQIAATDKAMEHGLSGQEKLGAAEGMLFVFKTDGRYPFWMKDMKFPLDILWLDSKGVVVGIVPNLPPCTGDICTPVAPPAQARYVLEVNAGFAAMHGLKPGSACRFTGIPTL